MELKTRGEIEMFASRMKGILFDIPKNLEFKIQMSQSELDELVKEILPYWHEKGFENFKSEFTYNTHFGIKFKISTLKQPSIPQ